MPRSKKQKIKEEISTWGSLLLPGLFVLVTMTLLRLNGSLQFLELWAFDSFLKTRSSEEIDERIVIIGIGEEDIKKKTGFPVNDRNLARLIVKIQRYKPLAIGLDLVRDVPINPGHQELSQILQENNNIFGIEKALPDEISPPPSLPPERVGFVDVVTDRDSNLRRVILAGYLQGEFKFSLSYLLSAKYLAAMGINSQQGIRNPDAIMFGSVELPMFYANSGGYVRADDGSIQILLNYRSGSRNFRTLSYTQIVSGQFKPEWLHDRIVLIGMTAPSAGDIFNSSGIDSIDPSPGSIYGVKIIAHSISQIISAVLDGRPLIKVWPDILEYIFIWICGILGMVLARFIVSPWVNFLTLNVSIILILGMSFILFSLGWWIPVVPALLVLGINGIVVAAFSQHDRALRDRICVQRATIEHTFEDIHNGPLQTLKSLMREVKDSKLTQDKLLDRLETLDLDLRKLYEFLQQETFSSEDSILLGNGVKLDLNRPLNELLFLVYRYTLEREFPCYKTLKITIPKFPKIEERDLFNTEQKRGICRFLEEALCNVGKYAEGATRLKVTFDRKEDLFFVRVEDNGVGITTMTEGQGSKQARLLARQLRGKFSRTAIYPKGTCCELSWPVKKFMF